MEITENVPLKIIHHMELAVARFCQPSSPDQVVKALNFARKLRLPVYVLGETVQYIS